MFWSRAYFNTNGRTTAKLTSVAVSCLQKGVVKNVWLMAVETHSQLNGVSAMKKSAVADRISSNYTDLWNSANRVKTKREQRGYAN